MHIMKLVILSALALILFEAGCATYQNDACPSIAQEAVSGCRASMKCKLRKKANYAIGLRSPAALLPQNYGVDMGQSPVTENFNECFTRELQEQEAMSVINSRGNL